MIDPNPVVGLPNFEWVELYNNSDSSIDLEDFQFSSGRTRSRLPSYELAAGAYVMLCDDSDVAELSAFGSTIDIRTFPSLTNGGDIATIEDPDGNLIHEVNYTDDWYGDTNKDDGGYSLELINPNDPCLAASNWMASQSETGATPATQNSVWNPSEPSQGIRVTSANPISTSEVAVTFDRLTNMNLSEMSFTLSSGASVVDIILDIDDPRTAILTLSDPLETGIFYNLTVAGDIEDCLGGVSGESQSLEFVIPDPFGLGDLIINEILFDPIGTESDYIEILNISDKIININQLMIGNLDPDGSGSDRSVSISQLISPYDLLVLTEDKAALLARYPSAISEKVLEIDLPSFNNTDGNVTLFLEDAGQRLILDALNYDEEMHDVLIDDSEGVALERVNPSAPSSINSNWRSGAASNGYGTPTLPNSQSDLASSSVGETIFLRNKTFFPENQSNELLEIVFEVDRSDYIGTVDIFDSAGRYVYQIANNQLIGRNDLYTWDGRGSSGTLENAGVYMIVVRLFTSSGEIIMKKLPFVLSRAI